MPADGSVAWVTALRSSHERLSALVKPLGVDRLRGRSYASEWSIAQVLSHLGSGAEIFSLSLDAGLSGTDAPGREVMSPIWDSWNARSAKAQADDALVADGRAIERLESLSPDERERFRLQLFGLDLDLAGLVGRRLGEHAVHTWDVAVVMDPGATVAPDAVDLLVDGLSFLVARTGKARSAPLRVQVSTRDPERTFVLDSGDSVTLTPGGTGDDLPWIRLPAEAFLRLVYGRLDPAHTPAVEARAVTIDDLRSMFPGF